MYLFEAVTPQKYVYACFSHYKTCFSSYSGTVCGAVFRLLCYGITLDKRKESEE